MDGAGWLLVMNVVQTVALAWIARCAPPPAKTGEDKTPPSDTLETGRKETENA